MAFKIGNTHGNRFKKGYESWNKGMVGYKNDGSFKKGMTAWNKKPTQCCADCSSNVSTRKTVRCMSCAIKVRDKMIYKQRGLKGLIAQQNSKEPTSIESKVYSFLKSKGVLFEQQKLINGRFLVDVYIPKLNLVIECDGDYWHGLDRVVKKDKAENAYLTKCGFNLIRLTESEIKNDNFIRKMKVN